MIGLLVVALGLSVGASFAQFGFAALAVAAPVPAALVAGAVWFRSRFEEARSGSEGQVLLGLAGALRAGLSLRSAIVEAGGEQVGEGAVRLALAGRPMEEVAAAIVPASIELVAAVGLAGRAGGSIAEALEALAAEEIADAQARREVSAAAGPMVLQAVIVGGLPAGAIVLRLWRGSLWRELTGGDFRALVSAAGIAAVAAGIAWIVVLVRRALA